VVFVRVVLFSLPTQVVILLHSNLAVHAFGAFTNQLNVTATHTLLSLFMQVGVQTAIVVLESFLFLIACLHTSFLSSVPPEIFLQ